MQTQMIHTEAISIMEKTLEQKKDILKITKEKDLILSDEKALTDSIEALTILIASTKILHDQILQSVEKYKENESITLHPKNELFLLKDKAKQSGFTKKHPLATFGV